MIRILIFLSCSLFVHALILPAHILPKDAPKRFQSITVLGQKNLIIGKLNGVRFQEASDIAYDRKRERLYMVGDEGTLYTFRARFSDTIDQLSPISGLMLKKKGGKPLKRSHRDAEGLALDEKGQLLISFEGKAKIGVFGSNGEKRGKHRLPKKLQRGKAYRHANAMLESVAYHPKHGIVTAAELPLKGRKEKHQTIYALNGKEWHFKAEPDPKSSVVAIEVMDDGNILVLERAFVKPSRPVVTTLKKVYLNQITRGLCRTKVIAKMKSSDGWPYDNFEGLARVAPGRYVIVTDDGGNFYQRTLLLYFYVHE